MKRLILLILSLTLTACGATKNTGTAQTAGNDPSTMTLPPTTQLVLGIFKLEGTDQAVTAEQAKDLLPLWQVYSSLIQSDTSAQAEIDALIDQIQGILTDDQMKAIQGLNLTQEDFFALMQEQGITFGAGQRASSTQTSGGSGFVPGSGGGMPGGGPPAGGFQGGGGPMGEPGTRPEVNGTPQPRTRMDRLPAPLLEALIDLLTEKAAS